MAVLSLVDSLHAGLKDRLDTVSGLNAYADWPDSFHGDGAIVLDVVADGSEQTLGHSTLAMHEFEILVATSLAPGPAAALRRLNQYCDRSGAGSILAALWADRTLGGVAITLFAESWDRPDIEPINGLEFLGRRLPIRVWVP